MDFSARFLAQVRQYAALESRMNRDFSTTIRTLADNEVSRLMSEGESYQDAFEEVNACLSREVSRFPVQMDEIPF
jgi:hypothetical protein